MAKPKKYLSNDGKAHRPILIFNKQQANEFKNNYDSSDFYYQEHVGGSSLYLLYYFYENEKVAKLSQQNLVQQPSGKSIIAAKISDFHKTNESTKYENLFRSLGFKGLIMVEVKQKGDKHYMIEANPRFWGPSQLFVDAGVNLFEDFLYDNGTIKRPHHKPSLHSRYFWESGLKEAGGKEAYHSYSAGELEEDMPKWQAADVYNREDTKKLFGKEMSARP